MSSKKQITVECAVCLHNCTIASQNVEFVQFCPFCGEAVLIPYDKSEREEFFEDVYDDDADFNGDDE